MRKTFLRWLLVFVVAAFVLAVAISYSVQTNMAASSADELIGQRLEDAESRIDDYLNQSAQAQSIVNSLLLDKARAIALLVAANPSIAYDQGYLRQLVEKLGIDEVVVTDNAGIIIGSVPEENLGYDMASSKQSAAFFGAIASPNFEMVQDFQTKGLGTDEVKYAGVARIDQQGIIQVGYYRDRMDAVIGVVDASRILSDLAVGKKGNLYLIRNHEVVSATDTSAAGRTAASLGLEDVVRHAPTSGETRSIDGESCHIMVDSYKNYSVVATLPDAEMYLNRNSSLASMIVFNFGVFLLVFILVGVLLQKVVVNGIFRVNASLEKIAEGDLSERVEVRNNPEFSALSDDVNAMVSALKEHIALEASRIDADLALARSIQMGNLRTDFPAFPEQSAFDLFARMTPAREVGGDFYDAFLLDERHVVVVVADVSGKGIPAAMFMMEAKSCIGTLASSGLPLSEVFKQANETLCADNGLDLFVTAFMASMDTHTGQFQYVNAGHNPPMVLSQAGEVSLLSTRPGFVLGGMQDTRYLPQKGALEPGDTLVLYTDGVTEALDENGAFYGEVRLRGLLARGRGDTPQKLVERVEEDVMVFRKETEQADDITVLALKYRGGGGANITVAASDEDLDTVLDFLDEHLEAKGFAPKARNQVRLASEEVFANIAHYAYAEAGSDEAAGTAVVAISFADDNNEAVIDFYDAGVPYDPLAAGDPDITLTVEERDAGGLGIFLTKRLMDGVAYLHEKGKNHLTLRKRK